MTELAEHELIARCRQGDDGAFRELVDRHKGLVFALVGRSIPDRGRAEELAQEVFLRVHRGLPYFRGEARLTTWMYRIVANVIAEERTARHLPTVSLDDRHDDGTPRVAEPGRVDPAFSDLELRDRLERAIRRLSVREQLLVNGHYLKGLRYEDLAAALDIPLGTVKTHLHRAKRRLRALLSGEEA
ncbi:MAG: RNA polymerase sigma factor [Vicinamibacterales bacterium]